jgi:hypothetical protein
LVVVSQAPPGRQESAAAVRQAQGNLQESPASLAVRSAGRRPTFAFHSGFEHCGPQGRQSQRYRGGTGIRRHDALERRLGAHESLAGPAATRLELVEVMTKSSKSSSKNGKLAQLKAQAKKTVATVKSKAKKAESSAKKQVAKAKTAVKKDIAKAQKTVKKDVAKAKAVVKKNVAKVKKVETTAKKKVVQVKAAVKKDIAKAQKTVKKDVARAKAVVQKDVAKAAAAVKQDVAKVKAAVTKPLAKPSPAPTPAAPVAAKPSNLDRAKAVASAARQKVSDAADRVVLTVKDITPSPLSRAFLATSQGKKEAPAAAAAAGAAPSSNDPSSDSGN